MRRRGAVSSGRACSRRCYAVTKAAARLRLKGLRLGFVPPHDHGCMARPASGLVAHRADVSSPFRWCHSQSDGLHHPKHSVRVHTNRPRANNHGHATGRRAPRGNSISVALQPGGSGNFRLQGEGHLSELDREFPCIDCDRRECGIRRVAARVSKRTALRAHSDWCRARGSTTARIASRLKRATARLRLPDRSPHDCYSIVRTIPESLPASRKRILIWGLSIENLPAQGRSVLACGKHNVTPSVSIVNCRCPDSESAMCQLQPYPQPRSCRSDQTLQVSAPGSLNCAS